MSNLTSLASVKTGLLLAAVVALASIAFISCDPATTVAAQVAVEESCSQMSAITDLDVTTHMTYHDPEETPRTINAVFDVEVSGDDWQVFMTFKEGDTFLGTIEARSVDGASYYREDDAPWRTDLPVGGLGFPYAADSQCPILGPVAQVGEESIDGVSVTHFTFSVDEGVGPVGDVDDFGDDYGEDTFEDWDIWIDDTGTLIQTKRTLVATSDDGSKHTTELTSKFSGIGEPNFITAPDIP